MEVGNTFGIICVDIKGEMSTCTSCRPSKLFLGIALASSSVISECHKRRLPCSAEEEKFSFLTFQCVRYFLRGLVEEALNPAPERHCQQRKQPKYATTVVFQLLVSASLLRLHDTDAGSESKSQLNLGQGRLRRSKLGWEKGEKKPAAGKKEQQAGGS